MLIVAVLFAIVKSGFSGAFGIRSSIVLKNAGALRSDRTTGKANRLVDQAGFPGFGQSLPVPCHPDFEGSDSLFLLGTKRA